MIDIEHCCICGGPSDYIQRTLCRGQFGQGWQELPQVYQDRAYCMFHFFVLQEQIREWTAQQEVKETVG